MMEFSPKNGFVYIHILFALWEYFVCRTREERHTAHVHTAKWDLKCTTCDIDMKDYCLSLEM